MKLPVMFIGHGSPMNAVANNDYTKMLGRLRDLAPAPKAVLCISAHWLTQGRSLVTHMARPKTIHDFYGFPEELFAVQYPAPGHPKIAEEVARIFGAELDDDQWGLDHGTWSVLRHIYPDASIPVLQLSMDLNRLPEQHLLVAEKLKPLREQGVLIVGSGNVVHNLRQIKWQESAQAFDWARNFSDWVKEHLKAKDFKALGEKFLTEPSGPMSVPTIEHYLPMLYILGASEPSDELTIHFDEIQNGSISMLTFSLCQWPGTSSRLSD